MATPSRWQQIEALYHEVLAQPPDLRTSYLERAAGGDTTLSEQVRSLVECSGETGELLSPSAINEAVQRARASGLFPVATLVAPSATSRRWLSLQTFLAGAPRWIILVAGIAIVKILLSIGVILVRSASLAGPPFPPRLLLPAATTIAYGAVGGALVVTGRADPRCVELGAFLLLVASAFADAPVAGGGWLDPLRSFMSIVRVDALMPVFFWLFVRDFPFRAPLGRFFRVPMLAARVSLFVGLGLWALNVVHEVSRVTGAAVLTAWTTPFYRAAPGSFYWVILSMLSLPAAPLLIARARHVSAEERRRVMLFVGAVVAGLVPLAMDLVRRPTRASVIVAIAFLSVPFTTAYSVLVARVADLQVIFRAALQYALARATLLTLVAAPLAWMVWVVFDNRAATVQELIVGRSGGALLIASATSLLALRLRARTIRTIDRRFFREQYDAEQILRDLVDSCRQTRSARDLAALLASEIDRALHVHRILVLERQPDSSTFSVVDGSMRPLTASTTLLHMVATARDALDVEADESRSMRAALSIDEQAWLLDCDARLLLPLKTSAGAVVGLLTLGPKRSELPYSVRDRRLLGSVGSAGGLLIERGQAAGSDASVNYAPTDESALECPACGRVSSADTPPCPCGVPRVDAAVPHVLGQKFRLEQRIGAGGMGVVYRALDLTLNRVVAIKTLPAAGPTDTWRLKREARAMARVTHPHLALILGAESWRGRPLLVVEYLAGGTLADKLAAGPLALHDVVSLGVVLADVLDALHTVGLLHRDVKPSNIGYTAAGSIKLLDFGLARRFDEGEEAVMDADSHPSSLDATGMQRSGPNLVVGTPAYMSPEAIRGVSPDASFDIWALSVVLFEAATGINPFHADSIAGIWARIGHPDRSHLRAGVSALPPDVGDFLCGALAAVKSDRPATARELKYRLAALRLPAAAITISGTSAVSN